MLISELTVYDFLKEKIKLSDSNAKRYTKELFSEKISRKKADEVETENLYLAKDSFEQLLINVKKGFNQLTIFLIWIMFWFTAIAVLLFKFS